MVTGQLPVGKEIAQVGCSRVGNDHAVNAHLSASHAGFGGTGVWDPDFAEGLTIRRIGVSDVVTPGLLELPSRWVVWVILQVEQHETHHVFGGFGLGTGVGLGPLNGRLKDGEDVLALVSSGLKPVEEHSSLGKNVLFIRAERVEAEDVSKHDAADEPWWVG